ncbi:MAG: MFS transporter [Pseudomonadales bacterium]
MNQFEIRTAASIGLLYVVRMLGLFMVLPVLPLLVDDIEAATPALIGLAIGAYGLSQALLQIPLGALSDRIGRKPVILGGLLVFIAGSLVAAFAENIYGIILGRLLQGIGAIASTLLALISDVTRVEHRSKVMAIVGVSIGGSFGLALILGPLLAGLAGLRGVFLFTAAAGIVGLIVVVCLVPTPTVRSRDPGANVTITRILPVLAIRDLRRTAFGIFSLHFILMSSFIVLPLLMEATGRIAGSEHATVYFQVLLASFVLMTPLMWLSDRPAFMRMLLPAMITVLIVASLLMSKVADYYPVLATMMLFFMAFNLLEVILPAMVSKVAPVGERGTAMGIYSTAQFAGGFAGAAVGGLILGASDISYLMYVNVALAVAWFLYALGAGRPGNYKTITCSLPNQDQLSASQVVDALLSVPGVLDVALIEEEHLAYVRVDLDQYDEDGLSRLKTPTLEVISQ